MRQRSCGKRHNNGAEVCIIMYSEQAGGTKKKKIKGDLTLASCLVLKVCFDGKG